MYRKEPDTWLKHIDFIILDILCMQVAFVMAHGMAINNFQPYATVLYRDMALFLICGQLFILLYMDTLKDILHRGLYRECVIVLQQTVALGAMAVVYLYVIKKGQEYSRLALLTTFVLYFFVNYVIRVGWKWYLCRMRIRDERALLLVTTSDIAEEAIESVQRLDNAQYRIRGLVIVNEAWTGREINGIQVVADAKTVADYICKEWVDEIMLMPPENYAFPEEVMDTLLQTGITLHLNLSRALNMVGKKQFVERMGDMTVLTTSINYVSYGKLFVKRFLDIVVSLVGCILTAIIFVFVAPVIYINSPGPIFFAQERVGKNGKRFKMYKFRSMYPDAEERKAELMKENKMNDNRMFKLDFDPRVIGNKILPDGTKKTGIGHFLRVSSLDEFPQFFNVLRGDMSVVGTRPPVYGEVSVYEPHHRARLAIKPGVTGLWQVSGRSNITDFDEVVKLDTQYINDWSIGLDIKIFVKTILIVFGRIGSV